MRYYLVKIAYNKVAGAEDRPQPSAYDTLDEALKAFHSFMTQNILGSTIGWCMAMITTPYGTVEKVERWEEHVEPEPEETEEEATE